MADGASDFDELLALADDAEAAEGLGDISASNGAESDSSDPLAALAEEVAQEETSSARLARPAGAQPAARKGPPSLLSNRPAPGKAEAPRTMAEGVEKSSGIAVSKVLYPLVVLQERFAGLAFLKLPLVRMRAARDATGPWATVGVLTDRSKPLESASGRTYSIWTLSDLEGTSHKVFLFAGAHQANLQEAAGGVFALFNGKVRSEGGKLDASVDAAEQLLKLGVSRDLGFCQAKCKSGRTCGKPVNKAVCAVCEFHVAGELKKLGSGRAQLRGGHLHTAMRKAQAAHASGRQQSGARYAVLQPRSREEMRALAQQQSDAATSVGARYVMTAAGGSLAAFSPSQVPEFGGSRVPRQASTAPRSVPRPAAVPAAAPARAASISAVPATGASRPAGRDPAPDALRRAAERASAEQRRMRSPASHTLALGEPRAAQAAATAARKPSRLGATSGPAAAAQQTTAAPAPEEEGMVTLDDDELDVLPAAPPAAASAAPPREARAARLVECDIDWAAASGGSQSGPGSGSGSASRPELSQRRPPSAGEANAAKRRRAAGAAAASHGECQYDAEVGGMVVVPDGDTEWLNGRAPMPHEQRQAPAFSPAKGIAQRRSTDSAKAASAARQLVQDAAARQRAAAVLKRKAAGGGSPDENQPALAPDARMPPQPAPAAPAAAGAPGGFYGAAAAGAAKKAGGMYRRALQQEAQQPGRAVSDFTAAFASVLDRAPAGQEKGSRYAQLAEAADDARLDGLVAGLEARDALATHAESVSKLAVSAWRCDTCGTTSEARRPGCRAHATRRVSVTKRWWVCRGCGDHSSTLGVRLPQTRCRRCPSTDFEASTMRRPKKVVPTAAAGPASRDQLVTTAEQAIARNSVV